MQRATWSCGLCRCAVIVVCLVVCGQVSAAAAPQLDVAQAPFGTMPDGAEVAVYTLTNSHGMRVRVLPYGAAIIAVETPDRDGRPANVTLGLDSFDDYLKRGGVMGTIVGRYANRIGGARFAMDGVEYRLAKNSGPNHIHGGPKGFHKLLWQARPVRDGRTVGVELTHLSPDGDEGYPGNLNVTVRYTLSDDNDLTLRYEATTDKPTHVNLTNHAYWNLSGGQAKDVLGHELTLLADRVLPVDEHLIPTGDPQPVEGTPLDFRKPTTIGARIDQLRNGYDHCYALNKATAAGAAGAGTEAAAPAAQRAAVVVEPKSGRVMEVFTTQPGVQLYTDGRNRRALCLETQHYPDSPNRPSFPSTLLRPGEKYLQKTRHRFGTVAE